VIKESSLIGDLEIWGTHIYFASEAREDVYALFSANAGVSLYYNNVPKFETTGVGATVFGSLNVSDDVNVGVSTDQGVILTSPNGTKYRLYVDDAGILGTTSV
jgi:hypothetical protein